ncbi:sensor histidine kinase [Hymenobacter latericus]|uniref:sensor histidine kinase n=1 Tax=Hymenobacter sp. YIM 151858-1 TaxID=2987688 RepID=UPI002226BBE7|nr:HAMP domain-containing sensor histidine kinase [Hymenobacter sp. YIM 151858-1]UYZ60818.1 HAMP domain-containing histidine kinase [Hymenobacter sp. YIM 151858-1]
MRLRQKLVLLSTLSKVLMTAVLLLLLPWLVRTLALRHTDDALRRELQRVQHRIRTLGVTEFLPRALSDGHVHYDLLQDEYIELRPAPPAATAAPDTIATLLRRQDGELVDFRVLRHRLVHQGQAYVLEIGKSMESVEDVYGLLRSLAGYALLFAVLSTLLLELGVIGYLLRPVDQIVRRLRAVRGPAAPNLPPLRTTTSDFRYLDATIQEMLHTIQRVFEQEREFIANASHELLTPVSILQNRFENMLQAENLPLSAELQIVSSQKTLQRLTATLRTLLLISRVENGQYPRAGHVPVAELLGEALEELEDRLLDRDITVACELSGAPAIPNANRSLLFTLFYNLLSNAAKYNHRGGRIGIAGEPTADEGYVLRIHNTGPAIPADQLPHVFERFRRADSANSPEGSGLGLALASTIAGFHDINLQMTSGEEGTTVYLRWRQVP